MEQSGRVKPLPAGPVPFVWPVKVVEALRLALGAKLEGCVEKHRNRSLRCSLPVYRLPARCSLCVAEEDEECGRGRISSAVISCSGF